MQISLTSLTNEKINFRTNQGISEQPETSEKEYSTGQIRFCWVYFGLNVIWKVIFEKEANHTKMNPKDLDFPHRELSNGGLEIVVDLPAFWFVRGLIFCVFLLEVQSSCSRLILLSSKRLTTTR